MFESTPRRAEELLEELKADQRRRWAAGQPLRVEDYLAQHPSLASQAEDVLDLIDNEAVQRRRAGETPCPEDYLSRFPHLADELALWFGADDLLASFTSPPEPLPLPSPACCPHCAAPVGQGATCPGCGATLNEQGGSRPAPSGPPAVPGYEVEGKLGEGGMGVVYRARHLALERAVALKTLSPLAAQTPGLRERFLSEARAVARLQHANVVQVFEVGAFPVPFFSMELVEGGSLEARLRQGTLPPRDAAALVETLARAMHHAHQKGIVHRDLKPANVLLAPQRCTGTREPLASAPAPGALARGSRLNDCVPKVTDFGLAKRLDVEQSKTLAGAVMGTAPYMAPEQARGRNEEVKEPADVYALGAVLYECLTGRPPFKGATTLETLVQVVEAEPLPPSRLIPGVPRDLEAVCLKCLEKRPARRYASALDLADDLARFLRGEPTTARPLGPLGRATRWVKRRPLVAALTMLALASLVIGTVVSWAFSVHATQKANDERKARASAEQEERNAKIARGVADRARTVAEREKAAALSAGKREAQARATAEKAKESAEHREYLTRIILAQREWLANNVRQAEQALDACPPQRRGWEWFYLKRLCHAELPPPMERMSFSGSDRVAFNRRGQLATVNPLGGQVVVWTEIKLNQNVLWWPKEFSFVGRLAGPGEVSVESLALSPDGRYVAAVNRPSGRLAPQVKVWETQSGKEVTPLTLANSRTTSLAFHPRGRLAAAGDYGLRIYDLARGRLLASFRKDGGVSSVAFSPDGTRLASAAQNGTVRVWDAASGRDEYVFEDQGSLTSLAFHPRGDVLAVAGRDGYVKLWEVWSGRRRHALLRLQVANLLGSMPGGLLTGLPLLGLEARKPRPDPHLAQHHEGAVWGLAFSPDGAYLASAGSDMVVKVHEVARGRTRTFRGHAGQVQSVAFAPDSKLLASAGNFAQVKFWDASADQEVRTLGEIQSNKLEFTFPHDSKLAFSPDGKLLASTSDHQTVRLWEAASGKQVRIFRGHRSQPIAVAFSADGRHVASGSGDILRKHGEILIWGIDKGQARTLTGHTSRVRSLAFSPDGRLLVSGSDVEREPFLLPKPGQRPKEKAGTVIVWDVAAGRALFTLRGYRGSVEGLAFDRAGRLLASASSDGVVKLHDPQTGQELFTLANAGGCVALDPDGTWLAVGSGWAQQGSITLYETATGKAVFTLAGHASKVAGVAFSPDGKRLASASHDGTVRLWDLETRQEILSLRRPAAVEGVAFSRDGHFLAAVGGFVARPGSVWLWDATPVPKKK